MGRGKERGGEKRREEKRRGERGGKEGNGIEEREGGQMKGERIGGKGKEANWFGRLRSQGRGIDAPGCCHSKYIQQLLGQN
jgi:hypothetical protein